MLEEKIEELTASINMLCDILKAQENPATKVKAKKTTTKPKEEVKKGEGSTVENPAPETTSAEGTQEEGGSFPVTMAMLREAAVNLASTKGKDLLEAILGDKEFKAKKLSDVPEEKYCTLLKVLKEGLESE